MYTLKNEHGVTKEVKIGDDLANAYEDGYQDGLEENKINNKKLKNLQRAILADAENKKEEVIAINKKTFEEIKGKEIRLRFTTEILEGMAEEINRCKN